VPEGSLARRDVTLLDLVDSILQRGAVLSGDLTLAVADVDLVQVNLRALLASVETVQRLAATAAPRPAERAVTSRAGPPPALPHGPMHRRAVRRHPPPALHGKPSRQTPKTTAIPRHRIDTRPENVERGLAQLVLTVVELLHRLMERQALYRMESGSLTEDEVERLGQTFLKLEERMDQLKRDFGLEDEELNLHLGPLGDLM
jgi:hypothetical protein